MVLPMISKALVTGANGFIGRSLTEFLIRNGTEVIAVDRYIIPEVNCAQFILDVSQKGVLDKHLDEKTIIFHLAARANVAESVKDPRGDLISSFQTFFEVIESARKANCQLIFPSSASICDTSNDLPLTEKAYIRPTSPYAAAKMACEAYCHAYHRSYGLNIKVARLFSVYGPRMFQFAIHDIVRKLQDNPEKLNILGDGKQIRDYLYTDDVALGLVTIAAYGQPGEEYNLASGIPVKIFDLAKQIAKLMGKNNIDIVPTGQSFPGDVPQWYADITKIKTIGFMPTVDFESGLKTTIDALIAGSKC